VLQLGDPSSTMNRPLNQMDLKVHGSTYAHRLGQLKGEIRNLLHKAGTLYHY
jgi:hypothetical protein